MNVKKISKNSIFQKFYVIYFSNIQNSRVFAVFCHFISQLFPTIRIFQENPQKGIHRLAQMDTDFWKKTQITQITQITQREIHRGKSTEGNPQREIHRGKSTEGNPQIFTDEHRF